MNWRCVTIWLAMFLALGNTLQAQENTATDTLVSLDYSNISIKAILNDITRQYGVKFYYSDSNVPADKKTTVHYQQLTLDASIRKLLDENSISFKVTNGQYVLLPIGKKGSINISGDIRDAITSEHVPFASIGIAGTGRGTTSNQQGGFIFTVDSLPAELVISQINYERKRIELTADDSVLNISLMPAAKTLHEVTVFGKRNRNAYYNMLLRAYDKIAGDQNHDQYGKAFYRQVSEKDSRYTEIFEMFFDVKYSSQGIDDWALQQGRYAFQNNEHEDIFVYNRNFSLLTRIIPVVQPQTDKLLLPLNPNVKSLFDLQLKEVIDHRNHKIAVIQYQPRQGIGHPAPSGEIYLDTKTYQVFKVTGAFHDPSVDIIKLNGNKSSWKNFLLDFEISFDKAPDGNQMQMSYIKMGHSFDYYVNKQFSGHIHTASTLTFYEYYNPPKDKKLGGNLALETADVDAINAAGYNPAFWAENPIVLRTPMEEGLVQDFDKSNAFASIFMNSANQIAFVPKLANDATAKKITTLLTANNNRPEEKIYLKSSQDAYQPGDAIEFTAFVVNGTNLKPSVQGSVLFVELLDSTNSPLLKQSYEIDEGIASGKLNIPTTLSEGDYRLKATTNLPDSYVFSKQIRLTNAGQQTSSRIAINKVDQKPKGDLMFVPEGGQFLKDQTVRIGVYLANPRYINSGISGYLIRQGQLISGFQLDKNRFDDMHYLPSVAANTSLVLNVNGASFKAPFVPPIKESVSLSVKKDPAQSLQIQLSHGVGRQGKVYLAGMSHGKILYLLDQDVSQDLEIPSVNLPEGVFTLYLFDKDAQLVGMRKLLINHGNHLDISIKGMKIIKKRKGRVQLEILATDNEGFPAKGHFLCSVDALSQEETLVPENIQSYLLITSEFQKRPFNQGFDIDKQTKTIDDYLIAQSLIPGQKPYVIHLPDMKAGTTDSLSLAKSNINPAAAIPNPMMAEIAMSGGGSNQLNTYSGNKKPPEVNNRANVSSSKAHRNLIWIPEFETNAEGEATLVFDLPKTDDKMQLTIEGISDQGQTALFNLDIDPDKLK